jgi:hypothetical protein
VPLVVAAICPHPPLLVPELAPGAAAEVGVLRAAAESAVRSVLRGQPDRLVVVGGASETFTSDNLEFGSWTRYGMPDESFSRRLPLSLSVGAWLLGRVGITNRTSTDMSSVAVSVDAPATACAALGADLAGTADRVAFLVMGDGSACRSAEAPGYEDPRAEAYDKGVAAALATADADALLALDQELSAELLVAGRAPWQVLAGAVGSGGRAAGAWRGELHYDAAPYGVGYFVATWELT